MKAREWLEHGRKSTDPIEAFSSFWRGFNNLFLSNGNGQERDKIKRFLSENITEEQAQALLEMNAASVEFLVSQPVIDMRGNGRDTTPNITAFNAAANSKAKVHELFMIIYQVRCNLVHGQKSPSNDRDIHLCACAAPMIAYVIEHNT